MNSFYKNVFPYKITANINSNYPKNIFYFIVGYADCITVRFGVARLQISSF